jgi:hypothetical protein
MCFGELSEDVIAVDSAQESGNCSSTVGPFPRQRKQKLDKR